MLPRIRVCDSVSFLLRVSSSLPFFCKRNTILLKEKAKTAIAVTLTSEGREKKRSVKQGADLLGRVSDPRLGSRWGRCPDSPLAQGTAGQAAPQAARVGQRLPRAGHRPHGPSCSPSVSARTRKRPGHPGGRGSLPQGRISSPPQFPHLFREAGRGSAGGYTTATRGARGHGGCINLGRPWERPGRAGASGPRPEGRPARLPRPPLGRGTRVCR